MGSMCTKSTSLVIEREQNLLEATEVANTEFHNMSTLTIQLDENYAGDDIVLKLDGPLTKSEVISAASKRQQFFIVRFPNENNEVAFLDTENYVLKYRDESTTPYNLSILMSLELANDTQKEHHDEVPEGDAQFKWTTVVMSDRYLTVTPSRITFARKVAFEEYTDTKDIPIWTLIGNDKFLTFRHEESQSNDKSYKWRLGEKKNRKEVVGFSDKDKDKDKGCTMNVYHVTSMSANDIPYIRVVP